MARGKPKTPARRLAASPGLKSPLTPGWSSAKASMFQSPKSVSPAVSRRMTRRASVYQKKTTSSLAGRKSPAVTKTTATKEIVIGEVEFKAPTSKSKRMSILKPSKSTSPAMTRARRSSVYHKAGKKLVSPPKFKTPPKVTKAAPKKRDVSPKKSSAKRRSASPAKAPAAKAAKSSKEESSESSKIPKPSSKSPAKKSSSKKKASPKKPQKKATPKQEEGSAETPKARSSRRNRSPSKSPTKASSPKKISAKKSVGKKSPALERVSQPEKKAADSTKIPKPEKAEEQKSSAKKRSRSPSKSPQKKSASKSPAAKRRSTTTSQKSGSPTKSTKNTPQAKQTPRAKSSRTPLPPKSGGKGTPAAGARQEVSEKQQTPVVTKLRAATPKASPATQTQSQSKIPARKTPARASSPVKKTPSRAKSPAKKTPARSKSPVKKTPSRGRSPARRTPARGKSPARKTDEIVSKSAKKEVTFSPMKSTPRSNRAELKRMPTPYVKSPAGRTPSKAVKVLGITPRSAKELKAKKNQRLVGRTPPRTSTPMGDRKRQAVFDPEVSTIRVKRTRKSIAEVNNAHTIAEENTMAQLNVNNNADDSAIKPAGGWFGWCTIL